MNVDVVVVAAGSGERLGHGVPKAFVEIGGTPLLVWGLRAAAGLAPRRTVVVVPSEGRDGWERGVREHSGGTGLGDVFTAAGGATRQASVRAGLEALTVASGGGVGDASGLVVVHDAARPLAGPALWRRVAEAAERWGAAVPVLPVTDCLKEVDGDGAVLRTVPRGGLVRVQTPQAFRFAWLWEAHESAEAEDAPDDAALVEARGRSVRTVDGDPDNLKVTYPRDLEEVARRLGSGPTTCRVGYGYDAHPLVEGRRLVLGGVEIPADAGLQGHSDADVLAHAIADALLGAAALGDIGDQFPADDQRWKDADSMELLATVVERVAVRGLRVHNVDATVVAERPRLNPHLGVMRDRLAERLGVSREAVNVKATRMEGLGSIGRGEGIVAHAVAALVPAAPSAGR